MDLPGQLESTNRSANLLLIIRLCRDLVCRRDLVQDELKVYMQLRAITRLRAATRPWVRPVKAHDA